MVLAMNLELGIMVVAKVFTAAFVVELTWLCACVETRANAKAHE
jgi:hypothetical protein